MAVTIWPSANDVAATPGDGSVALERSFAKLINTLIGQNFVIIGSFALVPSGVDLTVTIGVGAAVLDARYVDIDAPVVVNCAANQVNHIFLKLTKDVGLNANDAVFEVNTTDIQPADSIKVGSASAGASSVIAVSDARTYAPTTLHSHVDGTQGGKIGLSALNIAAGSASVQVSSVFGVEDISADITMNSLSFGYSSTWGESGGGSGNAGGASNYTPKIGNPVTSLARATIAAAAASGFTVTTFLNWQYITASDMPEIWMAVDARTGVARASWSSDDPTGETGAPLDCDGCDIVRFAGDDFVTLSLPRAEIAIAEEAITRKGLREEHVLFRALQGVAGDASMAGWVLKNLRVKGSRLRWKS